MTDHIRAPVIGDRLAGRRPARSLLPIVALVTTACSEGTEPLPPDAWLATSTTLLDVLVDDSVLVHAQVRDGLDQLLPVDAVVQQVDPQIVSIVNDANELPEELPEERFWIKAVGFGTTLVGVSHRELNADIVVHTWPAAVSITAPELGGQVISGNTVQLTGTPVGISGDAITGPDPIEIYFVYNNTTNIGASVDSATGLVTTSDPGLLSFSAYTITEFSATGTGSFEVVPQIFGGLTSAAAATPGQLVTVTQAAGGPQFDANTEVAVVDGTTGLKYAAVANNTGGSLTFANPLSVAGPTPVSVLLTGVGPDDVAQAFEMVALGPWPFDGTVSATAATVGDAITISAGASFPWDGDEVFVVGGTEVDPLFIETQNTTTATLVLPNPIFGAAGSAVHFVITNQGPLQVQSEFSLDLSPLIPPTDPTAAMDLTAGPFPLTIYTSVGDLITDAFFAFAPADTTTYTVTLEWANFADVDILWYDAAGGCCYFNFDGAGSANPERSSVTFKAADFAFGGPAVLNVNMYDSNDEGETLVKITVTSP